MRYVTLRRVVGLALVVTIAAAACGDDAGESSDSEAGPYDREKGREDPRGGSVPSAPAE